MRDTQGEATGMRRAAEIAAGCRIDFEGELSPAAAADAMRQVIVGAIEAGVPSLFRWVEPTPGARPLDRSAFAADLSVCQGTVLWGTLIHEARRFGVTVTRAPGDTYRVGGAVLSVLGLLEFVNARLAERGGEPYRLEDMAPHAVRKVWS